MRPHPLLNEDHLEAFLVSMRLLVLRNYIRFFLQRRIIMTKIRRNQVSVQQNPSSSRVMKSLNRRKKSSFINHGPKTMNDLNFIWIDIVLNANHMDVRMQTSSSPISFVTTLPAATSNAIGLGISASCTKPNCSYQGTVFASVKAYTYFPFCRFVLVRTPVIRSLPIP